MNRVADTRSAMAPQAQAFTEAQHAALFAAIEVNDAVNLEAALPDTMPPRCDQAMLIRCYWLCHAFWRRGTDRRGLIKTVYRLGGRGTLDPAGQRAFKHVRAAFKHLRVAYAMYGAAHRYPARFHRLTAAMGRLQDAFKNDRYFATVGLAAWLRWLLGRRRYRAAVDEVDAFEPTTADAFYAYLGCELDRVRQALAVGEASGQEFHQLRKIISRQVAFYCDLQVLAPSDAVIACARYVATINGLMGAIHDQLVAKQFAGVRDYHTDRFPLPSAVRERLSVLTEWYRCQGL